MGRITIKKPIIGIESRSGLNRDNLTARDGFGYVQLDQRFLRIFEDDGYICTSGCDSSREAPDRPGGIETVYDAVHAPLVGSAAGEGSKIGLDQ